jgi:hypothetical protein
MWEQKKLWNNVEQMIAINKDQCVIFCSNEEGGVEWKTFFFHVQVLTLVQRQGDFNYINFIAFKTNSTNGILMTKKLRVTTCLS